MRRFLDSVAAAVTVGVRTLRTSYVYATLLLF